VVFLCCCNSFHTLLFHVLLLCVLLLRALLFSHIVFLTCYYLMHCSFHVLLFSRTTLLTCNSKYLLAHQVLLTLMFLFLFISLVWYFPSFRCHVQVINQKLELTHEKVNCFFIFWGFELFFIHLVLFLINVLFFNSLFLLFTFARFF
jgi:hypothetical protein